VTCFQNIVEVMSWNEGITDNYITQTVNYMRVLEKNVALIINFENENGIQPISFKWRDVIFCEKMICVYPCSSAAKK
jgi:hypothetical protein